jgi:hypothetical protein
MVGGLHMKISIDGSPSFNLIKLIKERKIEKMAEIGVYGGKNAKFILRACKGVLKEYWGVDKYDTFWSDGENYYRYLDKNGWNNLYKHACKYMPFFPQFRILRMESEEAALLFSKVHFPDGYFDFVYIDANHFYTAVKRDIELWLPLIKKGGVIGGHDYGKPKFPGVDRAVIEKFGVENITYYERQGMWIVDC